MSDSTEAGDEIYVLDGATSLLTSWDSPDVLANGAVAWQGQRVLDVGSAEDLGARYPDAKKIDAAGGVIIPGLVNLHHHFYSALARGLDPGVSMANFPEVLDRLWWRLDRALDLETVRISAQLALLDCIRWGCHGFRSSCVAFGHRGQSGRDCISGHRKRPVRSLVLRSHRP